MKLARPKRLRDGSWGAVIEEETKQKIAAGEQIMVATRSGKSWLTEITEVIWQGKGYNGGFATIIRTA